MNSSSKTKLSDLDEQLTIEKSPVNLLPHSPRFTPKKKGRKETHHWKPTERWDMILLTWKTDLWIYFTFINDLRFTFVNKIVYFKSQDIWISFRTLFLV